MTQQGVNRRLTATEVLEQFHWGQRATARQNGLTERLAGLRVEHAFFFKARERIGRQHFSPLVAVVTRRVTARENVREAVRETQLFLERARDAIVRLSQ